jgi:hypothetical protein
VCAELIVPAPTAPRVEVVVKPSAGTRTVLRFTFETTKRPSKEEYWKANVTRSFGVSLKSTVAPTERRVVTFGASWIRNCER